MRIYQQWIRISAALSVVGVLVGCGTMNHMTGGTVSTKTKSQAVTNTTMNTSNGTKTSAPQKKTNNATNSNNSAATGHTKHGLKPGESLLGGNPVTPAPVPTLPKSRYRTAIPTAMMHVKYAVTAPKPPKLPATVKMSLPKSLSHDLTAYYFPMYGGSGFYVVGLNGMTSAGQVGADGSYTVSLKNSSGTEIDLSSGGPCQGCTVDAASMYFPSARKTANDYGGYHGTYIEDLPVRIENLNPNVKLWAYVEKNNKYLFGFAHYKSTTNGENTFMNEVIVGSSKGTRKFGPWVLQNTMIQRQMRY